MTPEQLQAIAGHLDTLTPGPQCIAELRARWPDLHFSHCLDDQIGAIEPVHEGRGFNLYLVTGRDGCGQLTRDYAGASGVVVAEVDDADIDKA